MPLAYYRSHNGVEVALWRVTESVDFFRGKLREHDFSTVEGDAIQRPEKALQWYASRFLMVEVFPAAIPYHQERKPYLFNGPGISLSHSADIVGVLLSKGRAGLDVQHFSEKLERIRTKFTDEEEIGRIDADSRLAELALVWTVKEAVFKCYGTLLPFKDIRITDHDTIRDEITVEGRRLGKPFRHTLAAEFLDDVAVAYVLE